MDFSTCRVNSAMAADLRMSHLMRAQRGFFVRGQPGTPQNELIASMSLWTADSPPAGVPPHSAENGKLQFCHFFIELFREYSQPG